MMPNECLIPIIIILGYSNIIKNCTTSSVMTKKIETLCFVLASLIGYVTNVDSHR